MSRIFRSVMSAGFLAVLLTFMAAPVHAQAPLSAPPSPAPEQFIQDLGEQAIAILADKGLTSEQKQAKFRQMLRDTFDLSTIGRFVIGRNWLAATPEQQQEYMRLFEELVVKTYSDRFALYTGEGFRVRSVAPEGARDYVVRSEITHPDGSPATTVDWRLRNKNGKLGIIDVVVEGVSMSVTQRQEYAAVIERSGGNIDGLLDVMRQHLQPARSAPSNG